MSDSDEERQHLLADPVALQQRDEEINIVATGVRDINDIFKDLSSIVVEQGGLIDHIEGNIGQTTAHLTNADDELIRANRSQSTRKKCLLWICGILTVTVLILLGLLLIRIHPWNLRN